ALLGRLSIESCRFRVILLHAGAGRVRARQTVLRRWRALGGCDAIPAHCFGGVLGLSALAIELRQIELGAREALFGGSAVPMHRLLVAALDARALLVREPQTLLRRRKSLLRRLAPPQHGGRVVLRYAATVVIRAAEARLRIRDAVLGGVLP